LGNLRHVRKVDIDVDINQRNGRLEALVAETKPVDMQPLIGSVQKPKFRRPIFTQDLFVPHGTKDRVLRVTAEVAQVIHRLDIASGRVTANHPRTDPRAPFNHANLRQLLDGLPDGIPAQARLLAKLGFRGKQVPHRVLARADRLQKIPCQIEMTRLFR
jgi:hypothetical protein